MDGFFLVDKPRGITSHDAVRRVRHFLNDQRVSSSKVGHAGTLDPLATGLLVIGTGRATKALRRFLPLTKTYEAEIRLGATSATDDAEGPIAETPAGKFRVPKREEMVRALRRLTGEIEQVPPAYSAVKSHGVRAYQRARHGERVSPTPRRVTVQKAILLSYEFPRLRVRWTVSSGTYIRALARDLGAALGTGAYVTALRRIAIGPLSVDAAQGLDHLTLKLLLPTDALLRAVAANGNTQ